MDNIKRISIVGGNCSGKSTLAGILAEKLNLPVHYLDTKYYAPNWNILDLKMFKEFLLDTIYEDSWILEGNYDKYYPYERFERSDLILFIDTNKYCNLINMFKRDRIHADNPRVDLAEGCQNKVDKKNIRHILDFNKESRTKLWYEISHYRDKLIIFNSQKELNNWLNQNF